MALRGRNNLTGERFFFVTTTVIKFLPVFENNDYCNILINNIKHYQEKFKFEVLAYVIMPSHFHWIVEINPECGTISDIMRDIKKFTAWQIFDTLGQGEDLVFVKEAEKIKGQDRKLWMKRFDDEVIRNEKMFWTKLIYIHNNPVEKGLAIKPEDYKYSSARNYVYGDHSILAVNTQIGRIYMR